MNQSNIGFPYDEMNKENMTFGHQQQAREPNNSMWGQQPFGNLSLA